MSGIVVRVPSNAAGWETAYALCRRLWIQFETAAPAEDASLWKLK